jgi:hypothetical protein
MEPVGYAASFASVKGMHAGHNKVRGRRPDPASHVSCALPVQYAQCFTAAIALHACSPRCPSFGKRCINAITPIKNTVQCYTGHSTIGKNLQPVCFFFTVLQLLQIGAVHPQNTVYPCCNTVITPDLFPLSDSRDARRSDTFICLLLASIIACIWRYIRRNFWFVIVLQESKYSSTKFSMKHIFLVSSLQGTRG